MNTPARRRVPARLLALALAAACAAPVLAQVRRTPEDPIDHTLPADGVTIPMRLIQGQPALDVTINGEGPFTFLLDTGAEGGGRVSPEIVERFGLARVGEVLAGDPSGRNTERRALYGVPRLNLGAAEWRDVPMLAGAERGGRPGIDGIIGFALFREMLLTIDYPGAKISFAAGALPEPDGKTILEDLRWRRIPTVRIDVAGTPVEADIDTGSMGWILLPGPVAGTLEFATEPQVVGKAATSFNEFEIKAAPLKGAVTIGAHVMNDPTIEFADFFPRANLGSQLLRNFVLTFDQVNRRVRIDRAADADGPVRRGPRYRVGVLLREMGDVLTVNDTVPGSPAARAGLKTGDRIVALNGTAVADLDADAMGTLFGRPKPIVMTVERDGETLEITVTPEKAP